MSMPDLFVNLFDRIQDMAVKPEQVEFHGQPYVITHNGTTRIIKPKTDRYEEPMPRTLELSSLRGIVDFHEHTAAAGENARGAVIHVENPRSVRLLSDLFGDLAQRQTYAHATPEEGESFPFGQYMDAENFVIRMFALFDETDDREDIIRAVSSMTAEAVRTSTDDGVSQVIATKAGIKTADQVVQNPIWLKPFRTFVDVDQPIGAYVFRAKGDGDGIPTVALFEVDDGKWRREAMESIREFFAETIPDVSVIV